MIKYGAFSQLPVPDKGETGSLELIFYFIWKSHPETLVNNKYIDSYYQEYIKNKDMVVSLRPQPKTNKQTNEMKNNIISSKLPGKHIEKEINSNKASDLDIHH